MDQIIINIGNVIRFSDSEILLIFWQFAHTLGIGLDNTKNCMYSVIAATKDITIIANMLLVYSY